jgi:phosphoglycolate phosphatase-like HAD superfamily hydrolase
MTEREAMRYRSVFFDFDGVIADTNTVKKENIRQAVSAHLDPERTVEFISFFTGNNGVPREKKVYAWFDGPTGRKVLQEYAGLNRESFERMGTTPGFKGFFEQCRQSGARIWVLSGGDPGEIRDILRRNGLDLFDGILAGPDTKSEHLRRLDFPRPALLIGDSRHDHEVAMEFELDFIFMYGYTQFADWKSYFHNNRVDKIISNLRELL